MAGARLAAGTYPDLRKLTEGKPFRVKIGNNTTAELENDGETIIIRLHGHAIVKLTPMFGGSHIKTEFTMCGYGTPTTRHRINHFLPPELSLSQSCYKQILTTPTGSRIISTTSLHNADDYLPF